MKIDIQINEQYTEPKVVIMTDKMTDEINTLVKKLSEETPQVIIGFCDGRAEILGQDDILRVYASGGKTFAATSNGEYALRLRLYELEERLGKDRFVRISNSEIINLKRVRSFDLSFTGTICVTLSDGTVTYVSRRYVSKIKSVLGI